MTRRVLLQAAWQAAPAPGVPELGVFFDAVAPDSSKRQAAFRTLGAAWKPGYAAMLIELSSLVQRPRSAGEEVPAAFSIRESVLDFVARQTGQRHGYDQGRWNRWMWSLAYEPHPLYSQFKGHVYANIDRRMREFFPPDQPVDARIRLDQVQWGGVPVNGIPPLVNPATLAAGECRYLKDSHIVFGVALNGEARAYPKRILAWHEMARDTVGGVNLCIVYCTLCGTVIPCRTGAHAFGTSGLLYESSKLMFDEATKSLWSTLQGQPVIGRLAKSGEQLEYETVVTTTWGEWRAQYPNSRVLSLETGHRRDYSEGAGYRDYFGTDELMFEVSRRDTRLRNKDEVLVIRLPGKRPLAVAVKRLQKSQEWRHTHEGVEILVRTTSGGANLAWAGGKPVAVHRAFWFGWVTQYPETALER